MKPPTITDIAEKCGVSRSTVSYALRNDPRISEERRRHIQQTALELDYRPNPMVRALMSQLRQGRPSNKGSLVAFLCFHEDTKVFRNVPFYKLLFDACARRAVELGYAFDMIPALPHRKTGLSRLNRILRARSASGVIIPPMPPFEAHLTDLDVSDMAVVTIGYTKTDQRTHRVVPFHDQAMRHTHRILADRGYRRIAHILSDSVDLTTNGQFTAFASRQILNAGKDGIPILFVSDATATQPIRDHILANKPEIVIGDHSRIYEGLIKAGFRVPEDIEFCCLNTVHMQDKCAGFRQDLSVLGEESVNLLDNLIRQNRRGLPEHPVTVKVGGTWIEGETMKRRYPQPRD